MNDIEDLLAIGERALSIIEKQADVAEVYVARDSGTSLSIQKNKIKSVTGSGETGIGIRIMKNGRKGFAYCPNLDGVARSTEQALMVADLLPEKTFEFPAHESYYTVPGLLDKRVLDMTPEIGRDMAIRIIDAATDVHKDVQVTGGGVAYGESEIVIMNSLGLEVSEHLSGVSASAYCVMQSDIPSSGFEFDSSHLHISDLEKIGHKAADLAVKDRTHQGWNTERVFIHAWNRRRVWSSIHIQRSQRRPLISRENNRKEHHSRRIPGNNP